MLTGVTSRINVGIKSDLACYSAGSSGGCLVCMSAAGWCLIHTTGLPLPIPHSLHLPFTGQNRAELVHPYVRSLIGNVERTISLAH